MPSCRYAVLPTVNPVWELSSVACMCEGSCDHRRLSKSLMLCLPSTLPPPLFSGAGLKPRALLVLEKCSQSKGGFRTKQWGNLSGLQSLQGSQDAVSASKGNTTVCYPGFRCLAGCEDLWTGQLFPPHQAHSRMMVCACMCACVYVHVCATVTVLQVRHLALQCLTRGRCGVGAELWGCLES